MGSRLVLQFLGLPHLHLNDKPITTDRRKAIALLAYLAVNDIGRPQQKYSREALSALLWPDYDQAKAFSSLRTTIWEMRQAIGDGWLIAERESVQLNPDAEIDLDVARFRELLSQGRQQSDPALRIPLLSDAAKLYRDHFLTGFSLKDAPNFNEWAFAESEEWRRKLVDALTILSEDHCALGQADLAIPYVRRLITLDPLNEAAHRQLMEVYWQAGQHSAALKQYQTCEQILRKELNLDPQPETRALYKMILKGEVKPIHIEKQVDKIAPKQSLPTGTVTFLFTDIEGSTQLWEAYPEAMKAAHARHESTIREVVTAHGGYTYKMIGDAFQIAFATAPEALAAALDAQRALHAEPWAETGLIRVRMALHTGVTEERGDDYVGPVLNRVARLLGAGHGGQVLLTQSTYDLVHDTLPRDVGLRDLGERRLKDLVRPEQIYQLTAPGLPSDYPPLKTIDTFHHNLPIQLSTFIGREKELSEITNLVGKNHLVTLTGAGGIGKTRLSIEIAHRVLKTFPHGLCFIELAPISDPLLIPQTIISTLGLIEQANRSPQTILIDFLQSRNSLLILDNCEHLIDTCAGLAETLLHACPDLHILATSREVLGIPGEAVYLVPSLTTPDVLPPILDTLSQYEAIQLFLERAQSATHNFSLTKDNAPAILQVCHHLDGIPLALELAAARVKLLRVEEIAARLDDRFRLLTSGARTALARHQTLRALLDWSHELLTESERVLLRRLSVFAGGWTLEGAESVCAGVGQDDILSYEVLDLLTSLVNKSLLLAERKQGQETRYRMLETIRQYAHEKLWQAGEGDNMRQRHLVYFVDLAERAEPNLRAFDMVVWLDRLEAELDNIRGALALGMESYIQAALRLASALLWFWHIRAPRREGREWLERALSIEAVERGVEPLTPSRAMIRGKALNASGFLIAMGFEDWKAATRLEESIDLFRALGPAGKQGMAYALLRSAGGGFISSGGRSGGLLEQSLTLFREVGDKFGVAECLMQLVWNMEDDDYKQALNFAEEHLALRREIGDEDGIGTALVTLGRLAFAQDDYQRAMALHEESITIFRSVGNKWAAGFSLFRYGNDYLWQGDYERATDIHEEALAVAQNRGDRFFIASSFYCLGVIAWFRGDYSRATQLITNSLAVFRDIGDHWLTASSLHALGQIALAQADEEKAAQWYEAELAFGRETHLDRGIIFASEGLAKVAWMKGDYDLAAKGFEEGLRLSLKANLKPAIFHALYGLGRVAQSRREYGAARKYHKEALGLQRTQNSQTFSLIFETLKTYVIAIAYPLGALAVLAATQNQMKRAASLLGAAEKLYTPIRFEMSAKERVEHDQAVASARAELGEEAYAAAWEEGKKMTLDEAVKYALEDRE